MGIVILRSMGGQDLNEEQMGSIDLAEREEIRRVVDRSFQRSESERPVPPSARASAGEEPPSEITESEERGLLRSNEYRMIR
ncbi:MAG: hypothetical protein LUF34_01310 [Lachnospiraceae bacterium]|nr:hypothetical protein [Lachnospiraceae bacterium]